MDIQVQKLFQGQRNDQFCQMQLIGQVRHKLRISIAFHHVSHCDLDSSNFHDCLERKADIHRFKSKKKGTEDCKHRFKLLEDVFNYEKYCNGVSREWKSTI